LVTLKNRIKHLEAWNLTNCGFFPSGALPIIAYRALGPQNLLEDLFDINDIHTPSTGFRDS